MTSTTLGLAVQPHNADRVVVFTFEHHALTFPTTGAVHQEMRREIEQAVADGHRHLIFNWRNVNTVDSSGLGLMLIASQLAETHGAKVHLCHISRMVGKLLQSMRIADRFGVADTEEQALSAIRKLRPRRRRRSQLGK